MLLLLWEATLDAIDRKILDILQADATVPVAAIADKWA